MFVYIAMTCKYVHARASTIANIQYLIFNI